MEHIKYICELVAKLPKMWFKSDREFVKTLISKEVKKVLSVEKELAEIKKDVEELKSSISFVKARLQ